MRSIKYEVHSMRGQALGTFYEKALAEQLLQRKLAQRVPVKLVQVTTTIKEL